MSRKIEEINTGKDDKKAAKKRNGVHSVRGIEALEKDKRGAQCGGREGNVV